MDHKDLLTFIVSCIFISAAAVAYCPDSLRTTVATLSDSARPVHSEIWYTAVNVTLLPTESIVTKLFRFIPAITWTNVTCNQSITTTSLISRIPLFPEIKLTEDMLDRLPDVMNKLPDWSLWDDRSVLVVNLHPMHWSSAYPCPQFALCSIIGFLSDNLLSRSDGPLAFCHPELREFSAGCHDSASVTSVYPVLFPVSSALGVSVDRLGPEPSQFNSTLNFVVSAGYRLPPGVFQCPTGLFPCLEFPARRHKELPKSLPWHQRICLPLALRCDGVSNCPGSNFDEEDCSNRSAVIGQHFPVVPDEPEQLLAHVASTNEEMTLWLTPTLAVAGVNAEKSSLIFYGLLLGIPIMCIVLVLAGWFLYRRLLRPKPYSAIMEASGNGHMEKDKSYNDLVDEVLRDGFTETGKSDLFPSAANLNSVSAAGTTRTVHVECV